MTTVCLFAATTCFSMAFAPCIMGRGAEQISTAKSGTLQQSAATGNPTRLSFRNGRLTLAVHDCPLGTLLAEISQKASVPLAVHENIAAQSVSIALDNVSLDEGLRRILKNSDAFFFYREDELGHASLRAVWIYPRGGADDIEPAPAQTCLSKRDLESKLTDQDPAVRGRAAAALIERNGDDAETILSSSLSDPEASVRAQALSEAVAIGMKIPPDTLTRLAETDQSAWIRVLALDALSDTPDARALAERVLITDSSADVRQKAREIVDRFETVPNPALDQGDPQ